MTDTSQHLTTQRVPDQPAPLGNTGVIRWVRENLFSSPLNSFLTLASLYILYLVIPPLAQWAFFDSVWIAGSREECWARGDGACWAIVTSRYDQFIYGDYPRSERWRADVAVVLLFVALVPILVDKAPQGRRFMMCSLI